MCLNAILWLISVPTFINVTNFMPKMLIIV